MHFIAKELNEVLWSTFKMQNRAASRKCVVFIMNKTFLKCYYPYIKRVNQIIHNLYR